MLEACSLHWRKYSMSMHVHHAMRETFVQHLRLLNNRYFLVTKLENSQTKEPKGV